MNVDGLESKCRASAFPEGTLIPHGYATKLRKNTDVRNEIPMNRLAGARICRSIMPHATSASAPLPGFIPAKKSLQAV